jgi:membrane protease YdiL (CAAX protease family)
VVFEILELSQENSFHQLLPATSANLILLLVFIPFVFKLPRGHHYFGDYLEDIGLLKLRPLFRLVLLGLSCYLIFLINQAVASIIYQLSCDEQLNIKFIASLFHFSNEFPPRSNGWLVTLPSILEEFIFRGVILTLFLNKYTSAKAIVFSALAFGIIHLLNLASDKNTIWVLSQVAWSFISGLFYGYLFFKTGSLLPTIIVHYLGNLFIWTVTNNVQTNASPEIQSIYGIVFFFGLFPTILSILWVRFFLKRWPVSK